MSSEWAVYRHKGNWDIRYYVEMAHWEGTGGSRLEVMEHWMDGGPPYVHLKACRNVRFDSEDFIPEMAPEAGMWPYGRFMELYEKEEG